MKSEKDSLINDPRYKDIAKDIQAKMVKAEDTKREKVDWLSYLGTALALSFVASSLSMSLGLLFDLDFLFWPSVVLWAIFLLLFALFGVLTLKESRREI